jgi:hypothetical protein
MILQGLKPRIFDRLNKSGQKWLQELPAVVWSLRTTPSRATGFTPFFLVYGAEAILPTDLEYGSPRIRGYDKGANQRAREDEARTVALTHCEIPAGTEALPSPEGTTPRLQQMGPGPKAAPRQSRPPQAVTPMGGTLRRGESAQARHIQADQRGR